MQQNRYRIYTWNLLGLLEKIDLQSNIIFNIKFGENPYLIPEFYRNSRLVLVFFEIPKQSPSLLNYAYFIPCA